MKKILFLFIPLVCMIACTTTQKMFKPESDKDVLRPPEGYGNPKFARPAYYLDSLKKMMLSDKPVQCTQVIGLNAANVTSTTVPLYWTATGAKKYAIYKNSINASGGQMVGQSNISSFTVSGLTPGDSSYYSVAMYGQGNKVCDRSDPILVVTSKVVPPPPPPPPPPNTGDQVICLMFDTITIKSSSWNGGKDLFCPGSGLTDVERQGVFDYCVNAYMYHPKIKFTMDRSVYDAADPTHRQMTIFTTDSYFYCGSSTPCAGGVSYVGSFHTSTVNFVFTAALNYSVRNNGLAAPHEMGHALGLYHNVDSCTQSYGLSRLCSDGIWRAPWMGGSYTDYQHYFYPEIGAIWTTTGLSKATCAKPDENGTIESNLK